MTDDPGRSKWHQVEAAIAKRLTGGTTTPGVIYPVGSNLLPAQLAGLPGAVSFFVSSYIQPALVAPDMTAGAEVVVVRHEGDTAKAYNWMFATSSDGHVYYCGPHKNFPAHHFSTSAPVPVVSLFGHPLTKTSR